MPGQGVVSYLRGINSLNTNNSPLFIIDGVPIEEPDLFESLIEGNAYNPLATIDPFDISAINFLKDPALTAVYGSRAANGILIIETIQPKATQTEINVSLQTGLNTANINYIPQLNNGQYKTLANEILASSFKTEPDFKEEYPGLYLEASDDGYLRYMHNTIWQEKIFSNSLMQRAHVSVKGGSEIATYGLSIGFHNQGGIYDNTNYNRFNVRLVSDLNVFPWLKMKVNASLGNNNTSLKESALSPQTNPILTSLLKPPIMGEFQFDNEGNQLTLVDEVDELGTSNPTAIIDNFIAEDKYYRFLSSVSIEAELSN
jgi:TonB-dependent SusC/RagA subfamily outer membrane receptor